MVQVKGGPFIGPAGQLPPISRALSMHCPVGDIPPFLAKVVVFGVVINHNLET